MGQLTKEKLHNIWFGLGLLAVMVMLIPYLVLGQDAIFAYHDQLDGELIAYLLQAKHLLQGDVLPEFLSGASKTTLTMPAPLFCILFRIMSPFAALVTMQLLGSITGYLGMYLLARENGSAKWIAMIVGVLYAYLPFLPVYGLSQYGIPLLIWCFCQCKKDKFYGLSLVYGLFYAATSSLVLVGFGVLGLTLMWMAYEYFFVRKNKKSTSSVGKMLWLWLVMLFVYVVENSALFVQLFSRKEGTVSHKAEYVMQESPFWDSFVQYLVHGGQHSEDYHQWIALGAILVLVLCIACLCVFEGRISSEQPKHTNVLNDARASRIKHWMKGIGLCVTINVCFALVGAMWDTGLGIALRSNLQALGAFQLDRLLWMAPCFWYLALVCAGNLLLVMLRDVKMSEKVFLYGVFAGLTLVVFVTGKDVLLGSNLKPNIQKLRNPDYQALSFNDYYAVGVLEQVENYILETEGKSQEQYKVVSLGIDPAAALYHGFYCVDGYSNNYSLEYKHTFREVIAAELDKSSYLQAYYDDWGNRCYLLSAECPAYYTIEKGGFFFQNLDINVGKLQQMGCEYLFSAAYILNAEDLGLELLQEKSFETEDSYYQIYLYGL